MKYLIMAVLLMVSVNAKAFSSDEEQWVKDQAEYNYIAYRLFRSDFIDKCELERLGTARWCKLYWDDRNSFTEWQEAAIKNSAKWEGWSRKEMVNDYFKYVRLSIELSK